ncbi:Stp1/IreP family PP2C-type Ser/Thr phosphatase [Levilactobacillus bambusae]|uniref:protein-serine/threonine phosphatase n=1 Tax=Levilactobacillus bambusae TaxID=2024736 RepID=A0A2V1N102_9LACO|nr:Stp1/IreP family PP2C-type Ser/Thr phosphatase [Levilactobacillus bambusae]PWG00917.1 Stp1/IreP family PP2C-type Ser/Thr phosphatase [Levilactobacillus bambusae]
MEVAYQTSVGKQRTENQDYVGVFSNQAGLSFAIIADGIGGNRGGDVASEMAVSHLGYRFEKTTFSDVTSANQWLSQVISVENQSIIDKSHQFADLDGMGTTLVAAILFEKEFIIANIGDSRAYLLRDHKLRQLTEDHSLVNELVKRGEISKADAKHHPHKNIIVKSLGISDDATFDSNKYPLAIGDQLLLCTDGLTNMVSDDEIINVLTAHTDVQAKCQRLVTLANEAGGLDNITVLLGFVNEDGEVAG